MLRILYIIILGAFICIPIVAESDLSYSSLELNRVNLIIIFTLIGLVSIQLFYLLKYKKFISLISTQLEEQQALANTDGLTGIYNRRHGLHQAKRIFQRAYKEKNKATIAVIDLDYFKSINDKFGHKIGDTILIHTAKSIEKSLRPTDIFCRYGGEEFLIAFPNTNAIDAKKISERIRSVVSYSQEPTNTSIPITLSIGLCELNIEEGLDIETIINRADMALYNAKSKGKNRTLIY